MAYNKSNRLPPMVDPVEFNKNKASKEFMESCKKAGKLFKHHEHIIFTPETTNQCGQNNEKENVENL